MANISYNELTYANRKYTIFANIFNIQGRALDLIPDRQNIPLSNISRLELTSSLTAPIFTGTLEFIVNDFNPFQLILRELYSYLELEITEYSSFKEDASGNSTGDIPRTSFNHMFLITKADMDVVKQKYVRYSIEFISSDIWNIENKIYLGTGGEEYPILELMSVAFNTAGLNLNTKAVTTFSTGGGVNKSISYTSTANDNLNSIMAYLQKQLLNPKLTTEESPINCESLVSYIYNHINNTYYLWNLDCIYQALTIANSRYNDNNTIDSIYVQLGGSIPYMSDNDPNIEICQYPSTQRLNTIKSLATYNTYTFDFSKNSFSPVTIDDKIKKGIIESQWLGINSTADEVFVEKYKPISYKEYPQGNLDLILDSYHSSSDSHQSIYKNLINILLGNDSLLVKTACKIDRFPGTVTYITIDESQANLTVDKSSSETDIQFDTRTKWRKLQTLNGFYAIIGNTMVFEYNELTNTPMFRNYLHLNRPVNIK